MKGLLESYPSPPQLFDLLDQVTSRGHASFVRLWLTEGIPFAFKNCPAMYEAVRAWLGLRLNVHPKQITLIGSGRIGFSLAPAPKLGAAYGRHSDLDFTVVSQELFSAVSHTFRQFANDFVSGRANPRSNAERRLWTENISVVERNLPRGVIDPGKIPTWDSYPIAQRIANTVWSLGKKFQLTSEWEASYRASVRVYRDWESLVQRFVHNLEAALSSRLNAG